MTHRCSTPYTPSAESGVRVAFTGDMSAAGTVDGRSYTNFLHVTWDDGECGLYRLHELVGLSGALLERSETT